MNWQRISSWAQRSDCGGYTVCAISTHGRFHFEAWRVTPAAKSCLGRSADAAEARKLCEDDVSRGTNNQQTLELPA